MKDAITLIAAMSVPDIRAGLAFYEVVSKLTNADEATTAIAVAQGLVAKGSKERKAKATKKVQ